jgi:hypothetical protein
MNSFNDWYLYGESLARCLVAVVPELGSTLFADVMQGMTPGGLPATGEGRWYRLMQGYVHLGPEGGDHHYQREPPPGVPAEEIGDSGVSMNDVLVREMDYFLTKVEAASTGAPVQMQEAEGQPLTFQASGEDLARLRALAEMLKGTRDACHPDYNRAVTFQVYANLTGLLQSTKALSSGDPQKVVDVIRAGAAQVLELRGRYAADARLITFFFVQTRLCELALQKHHDDQRSASAIAGMAIMAMESRGAEYGPEQMQMQLIVDFARLGMGQLVLDLCDEALSSAQTSVEAALNATDLLAHAEHLYSAAYLAFASQRLAEGFRELIPQSVRPAKANDNMLEGYARNAEEIVVRAAHALAVGCINRGSGTSLRYHTEQVRLTGLELGPEKAQEQVNSLINDFYFYPRYYAERLAGKDS